MVSYEEKYDLIHEVGKGSFGQVFCALSESNKTLTVKKISKEKTSLEKISKEVNALTLLSECPSVPKYYQLRQDEDYYYLILDYIVGKDLLHIIKEYGCFRENYAKDIFCKIAKTLKAIHKKNVVHQDLKLENIIYEHATQKIHIIDFGFSTIVEENDDLCRGDAGSYEYIAPEKLFYGKTLAYSGFKSDVWSLGIVLHTLVLNRFPWEKEKLKAYIAENKSYPTFKIEERFKSLLSDDLKDLLYQLLENDPDKRISLDQVLQHPWLS